MNMKKITALTAALCLSMVFAVSAFAAGSIGDPTPTPTNAPVPAPTTAPTEVPSGRPSIGDVAFNTPMASFTMNGETVEVVAVQEAAEPQAYDTLSRQVEALLRENFGSSRMFINLQLRGGSVKEGPLGQDVRVDLTKLYPDVNFGASDMEYVLVHAVHAGNGYTAITHNVGKDGTVVMNSLCPVVLMGRKVDAPAETAKPNEDNTAPTTPNTPNNTPAAPASSPKTGENGLINLLGVMAVVSGAGVVLSRKKK